ncbi:prolyl oligopeptidase family serine peptidase [Maribacter arcticus]|uniref:Prolyl oligopeptidase n=1 Tax=Maribacter arcticus TaxID=561365 RepID=A0A1T5EIY8_9FLAO|nr:prolyl oligopeptidase family serine peptidase [Maribacter arcticus]SKB83690.1 prolyl oligopeptidase [Maribacter arcticus]
MKKYTLLLLALFGIVLSTQAQEDKYLWLEEVDGQKALEFVNAQNKTTIAELSAEKEYQNIYDKSLAIYNSDERIAYPSIRGNYVYNFWKDKDHVRGIWRRSTVDDYRKGNPNWETLLDIDKLSEEDDIKWVYKGSSGLYPNYNRFLIDLSKGGGDAVVVKEFDVTTKQFIENGFLIEESKGSASYIDENTLIVTSDFGEGTMTTSGYPRQVKLWKRGTSLNDAQLIYEGETSDVGAWGGVLLDGSETFTLISRALTTFSSENLVWMNNEIIKLDIPDDASLTGVLNNQLIVQLKSDWTVQTNTYNTGTLLSLNFRELLKGNKEIQVIIEPDEFSSISQVSTTKNKLLIGLLTNVISELHTYSFSKGTWSSEKVNAPDFGRISIVGTDDLSDQYFFDFQNFITPSTLYSADAGDNTFKAHKSLPAFFDASRYEVTQYKAKSKDGTMVPYFMVAAKDIKNDGTNPTLVYAYGGFEISSQPFYAATFGVSWLDKGGVFVLANIRGGGEYGPKWHQDGIKEKRQNVFDDLYAVSEDLITKKVTTPRHLGIMGGSNGGLLVGVAFTQRPDLYNAVVSQVPLLDMQRYNKLLAGASWMGEFGDPDIPEEWEYIKKYSPYHNLKKGMDYPEVYFGTSTLDDRVHPGHARKMVAKMNDMGYKTYYYENTEGGHAGSSTNEQSAKSGALTFSYLLMKLK